jgi:hypothetical protein
MAFRLRVDLDDRPRRFRLVEGENLVGRDPECAVRLQHPTVSRRHAILRVDGERIELQDLGSSNGTRIGTQAVVGPTAVITPGSTLYFGALGAQIETISEADADTAVSLSRSAIESLAVAPRGETPPTLSTADLEAFSLRYLPELLAALEGGAGGRELSQSAGAALFQCLPCLLVEIVSGSAQHEAVLFRAQRPADASVPYEQIEARARTFTVRVRIPAALLLRSWSAVVRAAASLLGLADSRAADGAPAMTPIARGVPQPMPEPPSVVPRVLEIYAQAVRVASGEVSVLICGESGTGKEVLARYIHAASPRAEGPFVALNCAALPRDLLEAELFGIERGVATGVDSRPGKFELADGGTLFLDEVGDMSVETQARILRVLQEGEAYRIGGRQPRPTRVRVLSASNRDLEAMLADGRFRSDLYHRISDWVVVMPPLRERRQDIPNLAAYFLAREARRLGLEFAGLSRAAVEALQNHPWPGNIRQLEKEIARAALFLNNGDLLDTTVLLPAFRRSKGEPGGRLREQLQRFERETIERALRASGGSPVEAARKLGISRATLYRRLKALGSEHGGRSDR